MSTSSRIYQSSLLGESYTFFQHPSGLPVYVFPKKMTTTYALFAVDFGSVDNALDAEGRELLPDGVAHFLEHKLFSNEDGSDSFERFSAFGADANAYTSHTRTVYLFSTTERFFDSLAELVRFVTHPYFTKETVEKEQGIIGEEIRMCRDNPYDRCYYNMMAGLYQSHPVRLDICGSHASIAQITDRVLYRAYEAFYKPENMALIICGDVDPNEVLSAVDANLPVYGKQTPVVRRTVSEAPHAWQSTVREKGQVAKPVFSIGVKDTDLPADPRARLKKDVGMAILNEMLFSQAGELYNKLYDSGMISPELSADYALTRDFAFNQISGESWEPEAVLDAIKAYIGEKQQGHLSESDFERCRRIEYAEYIKSFDSTEEIANTLLSFVFEDSELFSYADIVQSITLADVEALLHSVFRDEAYTLSIIEPQEEQMGDER